MFPQQLLQEMGFPLFHNVGLGSLKSSFFSNWIIELILAFILLRPLLSVLLRYRPLYTLMYF